MAVIVLGSAKGSPGVTVTALALALSWPRPVLLLEADVAGGSSILAGYLRGSVRHDRGLVDLALAHRRGALSEGLRRALIPLPDSQVQLLAGLTGPAQAVTMGPVWEELSTTLREMDRTGTDVIVDAGRLGAQYGPVPLLRQADLTLLVTRTTLPAVAATRARGIALREDLTHAGVGSDGLGLLLVGEGQPYSAREVTGVIGAPVLTSVAWDPVNAEVFSLGAGPSRKFQSSSLVRSVQAANGALQAAVTARRDRLAPGSLLVKGDPTRV